MSARPILPAQIRAIHAIKSRVGLDDGSYRAMLAGYGVASCKGLSEADAERLLARMREIPGADRPAPLRPPLRPFGRSGRDAADGPYAPKMRAMWIAGHNLGLVRDPSDGAMHAFVSRQTGIDHSRWLRDPADARKAIEALKGWLERAGVAWPARNDDPDLAKMAAKRAVLRAQWLRCVALGAVEPFGAAQACDGLQDYVSRVTRGGARRIGALDDPGVTAEELDKASKALGAKLRRAQALAAERITEARHAG